jgi:hypothetical protein
LLKAKDADTPYHLTSLEIKAVSSDGKVYGEGSSFLNMWFTDRRERLQAKLYGGAAHEGWAASHVAQHDKAPLMTFGGEYAGWNSLWWKLYE